MDLTRRDMQPERMDDPALDAGQHERALRGLRRINRWSGSCRILWPAIHDIARRLNRPIRVLDVATGGGDVPIGLARRAARANVPIEWAACDVSAQALSFAAECAARAGVRIRLFRHDALTEALPSGYDVITVSLFLHHLEESDALSLLRKAAGAAGYGLLVNDLVRNMPGYLLAWVGTRLLTRSNIVHTDGPLSVRGAYNLDEVRSIAESAGLTHFRVERKWPFRFLLTWIGS